MTTKLAPAAEAKPTGELPTVQPSQGACADFVSFCKEQHLKARAAETFIRVLHNKNWEGEVTHIQEAMRPEVNQIFAPIEKALRDGANCREVMAKLIEAIKEPQK
ncbi:MAG TPA: hypothetical protein VEG32_10305 [Clostridia bacterium]|nr:hypothetical protein [Clostridia bacterium]